MAPSSVHDLPGETVQKLLNENTRGTCLFLFEVCPRSFWSPWDICTLRRLEQTKYMDYEGASCEQASKQTDSSS